MDSKHLITFVTFTKEHSLLRTSMALNYAPSTLSEHINRLEEELSVKLIRKSGKRSLLTKEGEEFLPYAIKILENMSEAKQALSSSPKLQSRISFGIVESIALSRFSTLFSDFARFNPDINLMIKVKNGALLPPMVQNDDLDLALVYDIHRESHSNLNEQVLYEEKIRFSVSPDHPLAKKAVINKKDLRTETFLFQHEESGYFHLFQNYIKEEQIPIQSEIEIDSENMIREYVKKGKGIAILPQSLTEEDVENGELTYIDVADHDMKLYAKLLSSSNRESSTVTRLKNHILSYFS